MDIDFGDVSMNMRALLRRMGRKSFNPGTAAAMFFLNAKDPATINATRKAMVGVGYKVQRAANELLSGLARKQTRHPPASVGKAPLREQVVHFINKKMPGGLPKQTARKLLDIEDPNYVPIIRDPRATSADTEAVSTSPVAARNACSRRSAWPRRPCCGMPACRPCCRPAICAVATRSAAMA